MIKQELPDVGRLVEIKLASGDTIRGEVIEHDVDAELDLLIRGPDALPGPLAAHVEPDPAHRWWTGVEVTIKHDERRVEWRYVSESEKDQVKP